MADAFKPTRTIRQFAEILYPRDAEAPILDQPIRAALRQWMIELDAADELAAVGIKARRTALMFGPPGCGKTTMAHHLAARRGLPLIVVNMASLQSKYVGETGQNVNALFDDVIAQADSCILFLDEFDSIAAKRTDVTHSTDANRNSVVIALLQMIDAFPGTLLAATNQGDGIDPAIWRRFGMHLQIREPDDECRYAILTRYLKPYILPDEAMDELCDATAGAYPALLRQLMEGIKRDLVISPKIPQATDVASVMSRAIASVRPHSESTLPPLWGDAAALARIKKIAWPPTRSDANDQGGR